MGSGAAIKKSSNPAATLLKIVLTVFNVIFWATGVAILGLGIWMKVELYMYMELTTVYNASAPFVLIGVGIGIVIVGSLGCCCTIKENSCLLYCYAGFLVIVFIADLAVSISSFVYKGKIDEGFKEGLDESMKNYKDNEEDKKALDHLQQRLQCCGNDDYKEWYEIDWSGEGVVHKVPKSCCQVTEDLCDNSAEKDIYTEGCHQKVSTFMEKNFTIIGGVAIGFSFFQLFGALLACCLAKQAKKGKYEQMA